MSDTHDPLKDPLDLDALDREIHINELREQITELGAVDFGMSDDCPPEVHSQFLQNIIDYESAPLTSHFNELVKSGLELPEPGSLDDAALHAKLWEVINALAARDTFISRTDHLSDRELYEHLWSDTLREEAPTMRPGSGWVWHIDLLGGCSEQDIENSLRYYDNEEYRQRWAEDFPDDVIPAHVDPPFDRDRHLPKDEG